MLPQPPPPKKKKKKKNLALLYLKPARFPTVEKKMKNLGKVPIQQKKHKSVLVKVIRKYLNVGL